MMAVRQSLSVVRSPVSLPFLSRVMHASAISWIASSILGAAAMSCALSLSSGVLSGTVQMVFPLCAVTAPWITVHGSGVWGMALNLLMLYGNTH